MQEDPDPKLFATEVSNCAGGNAYLDVWSAKVINLAAMDGWMDGWMDG